MRMGQAPDNIRLGGGASESIMHPAVLLLLVVAIACVFLLPRKYVIVPLLLITFLTPFGEQLYIGGFHFFVPRILVLCGLVRIAWTKMSSQAPIISGGLNSVDKAFALFAIFSASACVLSFWNSQAVVNQAAFIVDVLGGYFFLRFLIRDEEDILRVVKTFVVIVCILGLTMSYEKLLGLNLFGFIGGRLAPFIRDGAIRAQATFEGPIPAGTFAAPLLCLFAWLWQSKKSRLLGAAGVVGATVMVVTSASSTPLLAYAAAIVGISLWPLRKKMRAIRWGLLILLVTLHLSMKAPVWFLINHVDLVAGNSGYHRAILIDACVKHFSEWWLIGVKTTANWGWDLWDQANQFVAAAENGGLATLICFVLMISRCFGRIGAARRLVSGNRKKEWLLWFLGATLFSHVVAFFGISYGDQTTISWYVLLVMVSAATAPILATSAVSKDESHLTLAGSPLACDPPIGSRHSPDVPAEVKPARLGELLFSAGHPDTRSADD